MHAFEADCLPNPGSLVREQGIHRTRHRGQYAECGVADQVRHVFDAHSGAREQRHEAMAKVRRGKHVGLQAGNGSHLSEERRTICRQLSRHPVRCRPTCRTPDPFDATAPRREVGLQLAVLWARSASPGCCRHRPGRRSHPWTRPNRPGPRFEPISSGSPLQPADTRSTISTCPVADGLCRAPATELPCLYGRPNRVPTVGEQTTAMAPCDSDLNPRPSDVGRLPHQTSEPRH